KVEKESELRQVRKTKLSFRGNKARWPELEDRVEQLVVEQLEGASLLSPFDKRPKRFLKKGTLSTFKERLPADYQERVAIFRTYYKITAPSHITNMDEIPMTFDISLTHTVEKKGTSTVAIRTTGHEKSLFTVVLSCHENEQSAG
ncbi:hypothetical protein D4764_0220170, partial [Takifugu flavidus]